LDKRLALSERPEQMEQWEYRKFEIYIENYTYIAHYSNAPEMRGWDTIMDHWTEHGWELVSLVPLQFQRPFLASDKTYNVTRFLAVWKRRKAVQEQS
jgi:hypothetical protein